MYVRVCVERDGRHVSVCGPAPSSRVVCQTEDVPPLPARIMFVATASKRTRAGRVSRKWRTATSRNPSPFGLTVVSSGRSPANGTDPFVTWNPCTAGASASAARKRAVKTASLRLQFPYVPLIQRIIGRSILTAMRRLLPFALLALALALPAGAAARRHSPTDGTLSIRNARGVITLQGPARGG